MRTIVGMGEEIGDDDRKRLFKDHPDGLQLHAGTFRGKSMWHSDDGGKTWWCGTMFSHTTAITREELVAMAVSIIRDTPNAKHEPRAVASRAPCSCSAPEGGKP